MYSHTVYIQSYNYPRTYIHTYILQFLCIHSTHSIYTYRHAHIHTYTYKCIHPYIQYMHTHLYIHICSICMYILLIVYVHTYVHKYTHPSAYTSKRTNTQPPTYIDNAVYICIWQGIRLLLLGVLTRFFIHCMTITKVQARYIVYMVVVLFRGS